MNFRPAADSAPMNPSIDRALVWFRRDLRTRDHAALYHALRAAREVWCVFVLDRDILDGLPRQDRRVEFIQASLMDLDDQLRTLQPGAHLIVRQGRELAVELDDAGVDELDTPVRTRQWIENLGVEHEHAPDLARGAQGVMQRCMVIDAQVAPKPDQGGVQKLLHPASLPQE